MPVDDKAFETLAENTLHNLFEQIDDALGDQMEVDLDGGILSIELENGGQYIINKQTPNREIWMSSPLSGAKHYFFDDEKKTWVDTRDGGKFVDLLANELSQIGGTTITLNI